MAIRQFVSRLTGRSEKVSKPGTVTVTDAVGGAQFKGKATIAAVKRGPCERCGGSYGFNPQVPQCKCPEGWTGKETNLGVIAESRIG